MNKPDILCQILAFEIIDLNVPIAFISGKMAYYVLLCNPLTGFPYFFIAIVNYPVQILRIRHELKIEQAFLEFQELRFHQITLLL